MRLHERLNRLEAAHDIKGIVSVNIIYHPDFVSIDEQMAHYQAKHPGKAIKPLLIRFASTDGEIGRSFDGELLKSFDDLGW